MLIFILIITTLVVGIYLFLQQPQFGKAPDQNRRAAYAQLFNYKDGKFQNYSPTPTFTEGYTVPKVMYGMLFKKTSRKRPANGIPSIKTDLHQIPINENVLVWFGHSSYYMQIDGKRILVDPVFSSNASPVPGTNKAFKGTSIYGVQDMPNIDYLFISHDHYDHLDYPTITALKAKVGKVICGLGVGQHLEHWGYPKDMINEKNWHESLVLDEGFVVHVNPARHFSGRKFNRNNTLWVSYLLQTPSRTIFMSGDSGYDAHFAEIANKFGNIDLAILENGQYNAAWKYHHSHPNEVIMAAQDLKAKRVFPVHSAKFALSNHAWDEPLNRVSEENKDIGLPLVTPMIGQIVYLNDENQVFDEWWKTVQ